MAYDEKLAQRVRIALSNRDDVEEKKMFNGLTFMVDGKMCIGVADNEIMCRIDPDKQDEALEKRGCREMDFTGKPMRGFVFVDETGFNSKKDFDYWINLALEFNPKARASKKKKK